MQTDVKEKIIHLTDYVTSSKVVVKESILKLSGFAETAQRQPTGGIP